MKIEKSKSILLKITYKASTLVYVLLMIVGVQVFFAKSANAAPATLEFDNATVNVASGANFDLVARVDPLTNDPGINAVLLYIIFDPDVLQVNTITNITGAGFFSPVDGYPVYDNDAGTATIIVYSSIAKLIPTNIATINFSAISAAVNSSIVFFSQSDATINDGLGTKVINTRTPASVTITGADTVTPTVTAFAIPASYNNLTVPITTFTATDAVGVTGYMVTESATAPAFDDGGWLGSAPIDFVFGTEGSKTLYAWTKDAANNVSASLSDTVTIDTTSPTITSISSDKAAGTYGAGQVIDVDIAFSEAVTSTGNVTVTLETGTTDRTCTLTVSNSATGTCSYTVQAGDSSADLTVNTISGTIADQAGNAMTNFVPVTNLAANEAIVIEAIVPVISAGSPSGTLPIGTIESIVNITTNEHAVCRYSTASGVVYDSMTSTLDSTDGLNHTFTVTGLVDGGSYGYFVRCQDDLGNVNLTDSLISFSVNKESISSDEENEIPKRYISNSRKKIKFGQTLIQRGKKFSKNNFVLLYFGKANGEYYAPMKIKTTSNGKFMVKYVVNKPKGTYKWKAFDVKTKKYSKIIKYTVR